MKVGSIVKVPRNCFMDNKEDKTNLIIKITKIEGRNITGIVLKNESTLWKKNTSIYFSEIEIVTKEPKEVVYFT